MSSIDGAARIDAALVQRLVAAQFPEWATLPIQPVPLQGHDNRTFRLGDALSVRLPASEAHAAHVEIELSWLPKLAPHLPLAIPLPVALGEPTPEYPWRWSIQRWIEGASARTARVSDEVRFARDLAAFLNALRAIDARDAPQPGPHNFFRGGALAVYDREARDCCAALWDRVDTHAALAIWEAALEAHWDRPAVWIHGDVADGNLLMADGRLGGVIDFGQLAAGDPACDVTIAWTRFSGASRAAFHAALALDHGVWIRGRGWALWKALLELRSARGGDAARPLRIIEDLLAESRSGKRERGR